MMPRDDALRWGVDGNAAPCPRSLSEGSTPCGGGNAVCFERPSPRAPGAPVTTARRTHGFRESVIRGMTRLAREYGSINLAQGFPNFPAPELLKEAAARAIRDDVNQYAITWGAQRLRAALARVYAERYGMVVDPERELTVTCGA